MNLIAVSNAALTTLGEFSPMAVMKVAMAVVAASAIVGIQSFKPCKKDRIRFAPEDTSVGMFAVQVSMKPMIISNAACVTPCVNSTNLLRMAMVMVPNASTMVGVELMAA